MRNMLNDVGHVFRVRPVITTFLCTIFAVGGLAAFAIMLEVWDYTYPATVIPGSNPLNIFIEDKVIKVPLDVDRNRDCLASSTVTLNRIHDYGDPYGPREDMVPLTVFPTSLTPVGRHKIMLWFPIPNYIPPDVDWYVSFHTQDDCGGPMNTTARPSRPALVRHLTITKDQIP